MRNTRRAAEFQAYRPANRRQQESGATRARQEEKADERRRADDESWYRADAEPEDVVNAKAVLAENNITDKKSRDQFFRRNHPDKLANLPDTEVEDATARFKAVNNAWTIVDDYKRETSESYRREDFFKH
jgi:hypothetical protein